jgi:hypothetical protein
MLYGLSKFRLRPCLLTDGPGPVAAKYLGIIHRHDAVAIDERMIRAAHTKYALYWLNVSRRCSAVANCGRDHRPVSRSEGPWVLSRAEFVDARVVPDPENLKLSNDARNFQRATILYRSFCVSRVAAAAPIPASGSYLIGLTPRKSEGILLPDVLAERRNMPGQAIHPSTCRPRAIIAFAFSASSRRSCQIC